MARLPTPGGDAGNWGEILNDYLAQAHDATGGLKDTGILASKYKKPTNGIPVADLEQGVKDVLATVPDHTVQLSQHDTNIAAVTARIDNSLKPDGTLKDASVSRGALGADVAAVVTTVLPQGVTDEAPAINAALAAAVLVGQTRMVTLVGVFAISQPIIVHSDTVLDHSRATIILNPGSNSNVLRNQAAYGAGRDRNITLIGGVIDRGTNTGVTANDNHSVIMRKVDGLVMSGQSYRSTAGKYALLLQNVTRFTVSNQTFATASDGVHIQGPASSGVVRDVFGTTDDDMVAITPVDYVAYGWGDEGDVSGILIENVYPHAITKAGVKVLGGAGVGCRDITVRNVVGMTSADCGVWIGNDSLAPGTATGRLDGITVENVAMRRTGGGYAYTLVNAVNAGRIALRDIVCAGADGAGWSNQVGVLVRDSAVIDQIILDRMTMSDAPVLRVEGSAHIGIVNGRTLSTTNKPLVSIAATAVIDALRLIGADISGTAPTAALVTLAATASIGSVACQQVRSRASGMNAGLWQFSGVVGSLVVSGLDVVTGVSTPLVYVAGATGRIDLVRIQDAQITMGVVANALVSATTSGASVPRVELANVQIISPPAWIVDLVTTTTVIMSAVRSGGNILNVRDGGQVVVLADPSCDLKQTNGTLAVTGTGTARSRSGVPCDVSKLTKMAGDAAVNTNAALTCGVGPVICDGTTWKHLYSGATY